MFEHESDHEQFWKDVDAKLAQRQVKFRQQQLPHEEQVE